MDRSRQQNPPEDSGAQFAQFTQFARIADFACLLCFERVVMEARSEFTAAN